MTRRYLVQGRVQGVGFRYFVFREARRLGLTGWVRNLPDGRVEVEASGEAERLARLESSLQEGPPHAMVEAVETAEISDEPVTTNVFEIK